MIGGPSNGVCVGEIVQTYELPNFAFTPNGDGLNEHVYGRADPLQNCPMNLVRGQ